MFKLSGIDNTKAAMILNNILHCLRIANYPKDWVDKLKMINDTNFKVKRYTVPKNSPEWNHIEQEMTKNH